MQQTLFKVIQELLLPLLEASFCECMYHYMYMKCFLCMYLGASMCSVLENNSGLEYF